MSIWKVTNYNQRIDNYNTEIAIKNEIEQKRNRVGKINKSDKVYGVDRDRNKSRFEQTNETYNSKVTPEIRDRVILMSKEGRSTDIIVSELKINPGLVKGILQANGIEENKDDRYKETKDINKMVNKLFSQGLEYSNIAKALNYKGIGITTNEVKLKCDELGLQKIDSKA